MLCPPMRESNHVIGIGLGFFYFLNIIGIVTDELKHAFRKFDPVSRMIISRDNGLLNEYFSLSKGQLIDLYYFLSL